MPKPSAPPSMVTEGLATRWIIELLGSDNDFPSDLADMLCQTITLFDDTYSRFKEHSLIGQLNRRGILHEPPRELVDMFAFAHNMYHATDGAFDISVGGALQQHGYGRDSGAKAVYQNFWGEATFSLEEIRIPKSAAVDFGGFGKGWLLDKLAVILEQNRYNYYLINGGGDIVVSAPTPIELGLEHPYKTDKIIGTTTLTKGSLAVSSVVKRRWAKDGETYHHIIDPRTAKPADNGVITTYVKGDTGLIADTLATIMLLRPELRAQLSAKFNVQVISITEDQLR